MEGKQELIARKEKLQKESVAKLQEHHTMLQMRHIAAVEKFRKQALEDEEKSSQLQIQRLTEITAKQQMEIDAVSKVMLTIGPF